VWVCVCVCVCGRRQRSGPSAQIMFQCQPKSVVCGLQPHQTESRHAGRLTSKRQLTSFAALLCHPWPFQTRWRSASTESSRSGSGRCQRQRAPLQRTCAIKHVRNVLHARTHAREAVGVCVWVGESRVGQWNVSQHGNMTAKCWTKIERQVKQVHAFTKPLVHRVLNPWLGKRQHAVTGCSVSMALALIHTAPHLPSSCQTNRARCRTPPPRPPPAS